MALEFKTVRLKKIGAEAAELDKQWASLNLGFRDDETDHYAGVKIQFVVPKIRDITFREPEEAARASALRTLREALSALEQASLEELERRQAAMEEAEDAARQAAYPPLARG